MNDPWYPVGFLRCGFPAGEDLCGQPLRIIPSLDAGCSYGCDSDHRVGAVTDVDHYLQAMILGTLGKPRTWSQLRQTMAASTDSPSLFVWWDDATAAQRRDLMARTVDFVVVPPEPTHTLGQDSPTMLVSWKWQPVAS
jgi:hypothetical protein